MSKRALNHVALGLQIRVTPRRIISSSSRPNLQAFYHSYPFRPNQKSSEYFKRSFHTSQIRKETISESEFPSIAKHISKNRPSPKKSSTLGLLLMTIGGALATFTVGYKLGGHRFASDAETMRLFRPTDPEIQALEAELQNLPIVKTLLADDNYIPSRPHLKIPPGMADKSFTGSHMRAADRVPLPPLIFTSKEPGASMVSIVYLGDAVCGHPGIVHGGLVATLLDEGLARACFAMLPNKAGVTASLKVDYRRPCRAGQFVVLRAETVKAEGRKVWAKGRLESLPGPEEQMKGGQGRGEVLAEGEILYVEPKGYAKLLMKLTT